MSFIYALKTEYNKFNKCGLLAIFMAHHHNVWLISVPTGRFVVAVASLSHRAELPGGERRAASSAGVAADTSFSRR